jgi:hypothetical protein
MIAEAFLVCAMALPPTSIRPAIDKSDVEMILTIDGRSLLAMKVEEGCVKQRHAVAGAMEVLPFKPGLFDLISAPFIARDIERMLFTHDKLSIYGLMAVSFWNATKEDGLLILGHRGDLQWHQILQDVGFWPIARLGDVFDLYKHTGGSLERNGNNRSPEQWANDSVVPSIRCDEDGHGERKLFLASA